MNKPVPTGREGWCFDRAWTKVSFGIEINAVRVSRGKPVWEAQNNLVEAALVSVLCALGVSGADERNVTTSPGIALGFL